MGILDSLENSPALRNALGQLGAAVLPAVLGEVMGTGSQGGLNAIVAKLEQAGFGNQVKSWIGTGPNKPVTPPQLEQAIGPDVLETLSQQTGLSREELLARLSRELPDAVDKYTPHGRLPTETDFTRSWGGDN